MGAMANLTDYLDGRLAFYLWVQGIESIEYHYTSGAHTDLLKNGAWVGHQWSDALHRSRLKDTIEQAISFGAAESRASLMLPGTELSFYVRDPAYANITHLISYRADDQGCTGSLLCSLVLLHRSPPVTIDYFGLDMPSQLASQPNGMP